MQKPAPQRTCKIRKSETSKNRLPLTDAERTVVLRNRVQTGDEDAANQLFSRYVARLAALARSRLSRKLASRIDAEDVVMSAWRSFFVGARDGHWVCTESGDLWCLLVKITLHKLYRQTTHELALKRSAIREQNDSNSMLPLAVDLSADAQPEEVAEVADLVQHITAKLEQRGREVFERLLQGQQLREIAAELGISPKTVGRWAERIRERAQQLLPDVDDEPLSITPPVNTSKPNTASVSAAPFSFDGLKLHELIGSGSFSKVYRATHVPDGRLCSVKVLRKVLTTDDAQVTNFLREADIVQRLAHPHVLGLWGCGTVSASSVFLVQDLMVSDLSRQIAAGHIAIDEALQWVRQAAEALDYVHRSGLVHCDLKPANLLLAADNTVRVSDFGLAQWLDPHRIADGPRGGTPAWMAPELIASCWGIPSPATDIYGLAATLYSLLAAKSPFEGRFRADVMAKVIGNSRPNPLTATRPEVPQQLSDFIGQCLARSPSARPQSIAEFLCGLQM